MHWTAKGLENLSAAKTDQVATQVEHIFEKAANNVGRDMDWVWNAEKVIQFTNQWIANAEQVYPEQYWKLDDTAVNKFWHSEKAAKCAEIVDLECQAIFTENEDCSATFG